MCACPFLYLFKDARYHQGRADGHDKAICCKGRTARKHGSTKAESLSFAGPYVYWLLGKRVKAMSSLGVCYFFITLWKQHVPCVWQWKGLMSQEATE